MSTDSIQTQPPWLHAQSPRKGRYVIGPLLGQGGMGDVHEAWDVVLCRTVALKALKTIEPASLIRFMHEAQIHARVVHPNICRVYDVDNYKGTMRVAMQLVRGLNLEQARGELSVIEVVNIMALVAHAVHVVHGLNLVHRDLKPSNILLERTAEGDWAPFVCDFGMAMAMDEPALTYTNGLIGTPAYMAPEQMRGSRDLISPATDVFALGGTLFFALTGRLPGLPESRSFDLAGGPLPRDLRLILAKCLELDPEHRYPTANALAEDLWRFCQGIPIRASVHRNRLRTWLRRLRPLKPWALVLAGGLLATLGWKAHPGLRGDGRQGGLEQDQRAVMLAGELAGAFRQEQMLPVHDLRPSYARIHATLEGGLWPRRQPNPDPPGEAHYARGIARYLVRDWAGARSELEMAWSKGFQDPRGAALLAWATLATGRSAEEAAQFEPGLAPAGPREARPAADFRAALHEDADGPSDALVAYIDKDPERGAVAAHASFKASPWRWEAATLAATCETELAAQDLVAGDPAKARNHYRNAMAAGRAGLAVGQSDPALHHAYLLAGRGLAALGLEWGQRPGALLDELRSESGRALRLDPGDPDLQDDWLALSFLQARLMAQRGEDPEPVLAAAKAFQDKWVKEPLSVPLRADRMLLFWQMAEREFRRNGDPGTALTEALKTSGHTPFLDRDYLWEVLNFKARVEAARGADPRPALDAALDNLQPLRQGTPWTLKETLAGSWLIRAEWESGHGMNPAASLRNARSLAESARIQSPESGSAYALEGLAQVLEMKVFPGERGRLLVLARKSLRAALARSPESPNPALLRRALQKIGD